MKSAIRVRPGNTLIFCCRNGYLSPGAREGSAAKSDADNMALSTAQRSTGRFG